MGKLNILHHKDWHVYLKTNQDKVKADEKKEGERLQLIEAKKIKVEQERRITALRKRAHKKSHTSPNNQITHLNLFSDAPPINIVKTEAEIELKQRHDFHTMFLGETKDGHKDLPWYIDKKTDVSSRSHNGYAYKDNELRGLTIADQECKRRQREIKSIERIDPMSIIHKRWPKKELVTVAQKHGGGDCMQKMREERLERERVEGKRASELVGGCDDRHDTNSKFFNSQFNPNLLLEPREEKSYKKVRW